MKFYVEFCVESDSGVYIASWSHVPIRGVGETPTKAIDNLKKKLNEALHDRDTLRKVGNEIVNMILTETNNWSHDQVLKHPGL